MVIPGFQALLKARRPVAGLEPATERSQQISGRIRYPCAKTNSQDDSVLHHFGHSGIDTKSFPSAQVKYKNYAEESLHLEVSSDTEQARVKIQYSPQLDAVDVPLFANAGVRILSNGIFKGKYGLASNQEDDDSMPLVVDNFDVTIDVSHISTML
ncbi:hypothetical protein PoB_005900300 [Plakobranchus ocellatus]|uniref:Uncharacterized protein n=1 Tax=Plakobranchus ocellatus TaxID=259542 RepID=A0AAV4CKG8_9GAST|nr:hypothetical protein PoB_005900300 [Plakobranchus ocellatus]